MTEPIAHACKKKCRIYVERAQHNPESGYF